METLKLEKSEAKKLFPVVPDWFKKTLISSFGAACFSEKITDRIKTFNDACMEAGVDPDDVYLADDTMDEVAYKKLKVIIKVMNQGWTPDWDNTDQKKWYPWFNLSSGFGFSNSLSGYTLTATSVGSRLCFESKDKSDYIANQFINLYKDLITI